MDLDKQAIKKRIDEIEALMQSADFWNDKNKAQSLVKELKEIKEEFESGGAKAKYDKGDAIITIFSGAGGDDAEDFSSILFKMYRKYIEKMGFGMEIIHVNENDHGGYRNITFEVKGRGVYGILKNESGVHRLVRISPFNAKKTKTYIFFYG
jgi:peptide chain release factor 2